MEVAQVAPIDRSLLISAIRFRRSCPTSCSASGDFERENITTI